MPGPLVLAAPTVIGGGMSAIAKAAAALGFVGTGALVGKAVSDTYNNVQPNNRMGTIDQFSNEDFIKDFKRREAKAASDGQNPNPQDGTTQALDAISDPRSPYNSNSGIVKNQEQTMYADRDDMDRRYRQANNFQLDNQLKKANFDNQYTGAENMLNRYVQMRQSGNQLLAGAYQFKY